MAITVLLAVMVLALASNGSVSTMTGDARQMPRRKPSIPDPNKD